LHHLSRQRRLVDRTPEARRNPDLRTGPQRACRQQPKSDRLSFTTDLALAAKGTDAVSIAIGTMSHRGNGHADLSYVYAAAKTIAGALDGFTVVVNKSTVPVGNHAEVERIILETNSRVDFAVV
jgi:UDPglucose 6-dehydrogenase